MPQIKKDIRQFDPSNHIKTPTNLSKLNVPSTPRLLSSIPGSPSYKPTVPNSVAGVKVNPQFQKAVNNPVGTTKKAISNAGGNLSSGAKNFGGAISSGSKSVFSKW